MDRKRLITACLPLLALLAATFACGAPVPGKPIVSVLAPFNGARVAVGQAVEVQFRAEDARAVSWVKMEVDGAAVATMESPVAKGQTPLEGILRWTPAEAGTFSLMLTAHSAAGQDSDPAAVTVEVVEASAGLPDPTSVPTVPPKATQSATAPTATTKASAPTAAPTATTKPGAPTATTETGAPTAVPTAVPTNPPTAVPTNPPTAAPTKQPTALPTDTPPPTATMIPSPEILAFYPDVDTIAPGQCTTIHWQTKNANDVRLDSEMVAASGDRTYCSADLATGVNAFELQASNGWETALRSLTITNREPQVLNAPFVPAFSGSASDHGAVGVKVYPGDDAAGNNYIGFMSFDITALPGDATIKSATLNLGPCATNGNPFADLAGELYVTYLYYGDLETGDYFAGGGEYVGSVYGCPGGQIDVTASLDAHKSPAYYQITLSWPVKSDFDGATDDVTYTSPSLEIVYLP
jgi:hypothetical protein